MGESRLNFRGGTVLPRFLFQNQYINSSISHARNVYTVSGKTDERETKSVHVNINDVNDVLSIRST